MWTRFRAVSISLVVAVVAMAGIGAAPRIARAAELPSQPGSQQDLRTDGSTVVWVNLPDNTVAELDIYAAPVDGGPLQPVATTDAWEYNADIDDGAVVWQEETACYGCAGAIRGLRLATNEPFTVAEAGDASNSLPVIDGDLVVWERGSTAEGWQLAGRHIAPLGDPFTVAHLTHPLYGRPAVAGERIAWVEYNADAGPKEVRWQLFVANLADADGTLRPVASGIYLPTFGLAGDELVFVDDSNQVTALNLATDTERVIGTGSSVTTDGRYVFWEHSVPPKEFGDSRQDIVGYDLHSGAELAVATDQYLNFQPFTKGGAVVWSHSEDGSERAKATHVQAILPSAPLPDPGTTSPDWYYFPETGHYLSHDFKGFWDGSGGLPVFGYTLTEEFPELNADTGQTYIVQYLERQRFEFHPENAGTSYLVLLGRLGVTDAQRRGLLDTAPFAPVEPTGGGLDCIYMAEVGHYLCDSFWAYWKSHGLEFGDPGVSFRESLALFGYPISEEFVDPDTGLVVQYFERARFEHHPENAGTQYEVLLGRLAAVEIEARGW
jgi:hypothetical protein